VRERERERERERGALDSDLALSSSEMLANDAMLPKERIRELLAGDPAAWNNFDLTFRNIKHIYKKVQHLFLENPLHTKEQLFCANEGWEEVRKRALLKNASTRWAGRTEVNLEAKRELEDKNLMAAVLERWCENVEQRMVFTRTLHTNTHKINTHTHTQYMQV
jgi:hypothetical protein